MSFAMDGPAYAAAPVVAAKIDRYLAGRREHASRIYPGVALLTDAISAAFWASLRREEGYLPRISLALLPPEEASHPLRFERPLPFEPAVLTRIAPSVEHAGVHLGVWREGDRLCVWGHVRVIQPYCIVIETPSPGLLVVKHPSAGGSRKFVNIAVIEGDRIKMIDQHASSLPDCPDLVTSLLGFDSSANWSASINVLVQLAISMRAHGRGGSLLIVPAGSDHWLESIRRPISYAVSPPFSELRRLKLGDPDGGRTNPEEWADVVNAIAGLTAVDGAAVMNSDFEVLAFGAKIVRRKGGSPIEQVALTEPIERGEAALISPEQLGGTRHLSAAQFVQDQKDATALVASQDGRFTIFAWSPCETMVHAHRVDTLLL